MERREEEHVQGLAPEAVVMWVTVCLVQESNSQKPLSFENDAEFPKHVSEAGISRLHAHRYHVHVAVFLLKVCLWSRKW